jgi:hypothetical protein
MLQFLKPERLDPYIGSCDGIALPVRARDDPHSAEARWRTSSTAATISAPLASAAVAESKGAAKRMTVAGREGRRYSGREAPMDLA